MPPRQIVAMGGGGFSMEPDNLLLDEYALSLTGKARPRVCFLATASSDSEQYIYRFHKSLRKLTPRTTQLKLTPPDKDDIRAHLLAQDLIYVSGGNTMKMLQIWRQYGVDDILREAYEAGIVLAGISAGSICWFEWALTDSIPGKLTVLQGLGFLRGSNCVHYDGEAERRPAYQAAVASGRSAGYACDDGVALHYVDDVLRRVICSRPDARAFRVDREGAATGQTVREVPLVPEYVGKVIKAKHTVLRRASISDSKGIFTAHRRSIREIAARDYTASQIAAWTARSFTDETASDLAFQIRQEFVWVAECAGVIEGFVHMRVPQDLVSSGYLHALYLSPTIVGKGVGRRLMTLAEEEARKMGLKRMVLHASKTAYGFYMKLGYDQVGEQMMHTVQGVGLPCFPMAKSLASP